jgi:hypothetical protein
MSVRKGSKTAIVRKAYDDAGGRGAKEKSYTAAVRAGERAGLLPHSVRSLISLWHRGIVSRSTDGKAAKTSKRRVKRVAKKTAVKRVVKKVERVAKKAAA